MNFGNKRKEADFNKAQFRLPHQALDVDDVLSCGEK